MNNSLGNRRKFIKTTFAGGLGIGLTTPTILAKDLINAKETRIGIIGLDTSHSGAFTKYIHSLNNGFKVVAAYTTITKDIPSCYERVDKFTQQIKEEGVRIVNSVDQLLEQVDCVLLETADGRHRLAQAEKVFKSGKPVFMDKAVAASLKDVAAIYNLAKKYNISTFSSSGTRFMSKAQEARNGEIGDVLGAETFSPISYEPSHSELFWYGIHGVELLFTVMRGGCKKVRRIKTESSDLVTGEWKDGRVGTFRGIVKGKKTYGGQAFGSEKNSYLGGWEGYEPLVDHIIHYFKTGEVPVEPSETMEIYAFMEAAAESTRQNGSWVTLDSVLDKAGYKG